MNLKQIGWCVLNKKGEAVSRRESNIAFKTPETPAVYSRLSSARVKASRTGHGRIVDVYVDLDSAPADAAKEGK